ncbi:MAG: hypothetical protein RIS21_265 [Planctomycetota bacterium]|jgi:hypothetical protein
MGLTFTRTVLDDVADLATVSASFSGRDRENTEARLRHLIVADPFGFSGIVVRHSGAVVAHMAATHLPVSVFGNDLRVGRLTSCFVHPDFRAGGWHGLPHELDAAFAEAFENDDGFRTTLATFAESDFWQFRRLADHEAVRTHVELVRHVGTSCHVPTGEGDIVDVDASFMDRWTSPFRPSETCTLRDGALYRFRLSGPWAGDRAVAVLRDGTMHAVAILRDRGDVRTVLDFAVDSDEGCMHRLIASIVGDGTLRIEIPAFGRSSALLALQRVGFRVRVGREVMVSTRSSRPRVNGAALAEHWSLCAADAGLAPLAVLLPADDPCTGAPPGTRAGSEKHL